MTTGRINQVICGFKQNIRHYGNDDVFYFYDVQKLHMVDFSGIQGTLDIVVKRRQSASNFSHRSPQKKTTHNFKADSPSWQSPLPGRARFLAEPASWQSPLPGKIPA